MKKVIIQTAFFMLLALTSFAQKSETIVSWNFFTQIEGGIDNLIPSIMSADVTSKGIVKGKGLSKNNEFKQPKYWGAKGFSFDKNGPEDGVKKEKFITFSFTTNAVKSLSLDEIKPLRIKISSIGPVNYTFQYSFDGVEFKDITTIKVDNPVKFSDVITPAVKLSDVKDLQKIATGKTVYMRIIPWGAKGNEYNDCYLGSSYDYAALTVTGNFK
jgi:hypothetical protein